MRIVILGDIHDRVTNLDRVLESLAGHQPDAMFCLGDVASAETLTRLAQSFPKEIHVVLGNVDSEDEIKRTIDTNRLLHVYYQGRIGRLTLDKRRFAFTHMPLDAEPLTDEEFDAVFYGHTHTAKTETRNGTLLINPGDVQGRFGQDPSYTIYDTDTGTAETHTVT